MIYFKQDAIPQTVVLGANTTIRIGNDAFSYSGIGDTDLRQLGFIPVNKSALLTGQEHGIAFIRQGEDGKDELFYPAVWAINPETGTQFADEQEAIGYYNGLKVYDRQAIIELFPSAVFAQIALITEPALSNFDADIFVFWKMLNTMERFKLNDPRLQSGVNLLVSKGIITAEQAAAVLRGEALNAQL